MSKYAGGSLGEIIRSFHWSLFLSIVQGCMAKLEKVSGISPVSAPFVGKWKVACWMKLATTSHHPTSLETSLRIHFDSSVKNNECILPSFHPLWVRNGWGQMSHDRIFSRLQPTWTPSFRLGLHFSGTLFGHVVRKDEPLWEWVCKLGTSRKDRGAFFILDLRPSPRSDWVKCVLIKLKLAISRPLQGRGFVWLSVPLATWKEECAQFRLGTRVFALWSLDVEIGVECFIVRKWSGNHLQWSTFQFRLVRNWMRCQSLDWCPSHSLGTLAGSMSKSHFPTFFFIFSLFVFIGWFSSQKP